VPNVRLLPQRNERIDPRGAQQRDRDRQQRDGREDEDYDDVHDRIGGADAEQQPARNRDAASAAATPIARPSAVIVPA
jgi:hypothetical protein